MSLHKHCYLNFSHRTRHTAQQFPILNSSNCHSAIQLPNPSSHSPNHRTKNKATITSVHDLSLSERTSPHNPHKPHQSRQNSKCIPVTNPSPSPSPMPLRVFKLHNPTLLPILLTRRENKTMKDTDRFCVVVVAMMYFIIIEFGRFTSGNACGV